MKIMLITLVLLFSAQSFACMPPRKAWVKQTSEMRTVLESEELRGLLNDLDVNYITGIEVVRNGYKVTTGTPCSILVKFSYKIRRAGACPELQEVKYDLTCESRE
ncbi:MAG: hypothetical protein KDD37_03820 [Bdellovibrionales bacterium]|nr:hypothetical protein [Bdellovibrionales bacterium]